VTPYRRKPTLSKTRFCTGLQCLKRLYWSFYKPEGFVEEITPQQQAIFDQGHEVGILAQKRFPGGVLVGEDYTRQAAAEKRTQSLMADSNVPAIYEAAFTFEGIRIRADILERLPCNCWRLVEVKSSTGVKDYQLPDLTIQKHVLEGCGLTVPSACLLHLNREYVHDGGDYDLDGLFTQEDMTDAVTERMSDLPEQLAQQWEVLGQATPPDITPGRQCLEPYECEFYDLCNEEPAEDWVGLLPKISETQLSLLLDSGVKSIVDIPEGFRLTAVQKRARKAHEVGGIVMEPRLQSELDNLDWPRYFMDFETHMPALPRFAGMRPYDQLPFQWCVYVQESPKANPSLHEYLAENAQDPREDFITSLLKALGDEGPIITYNAPFESGRLSDLAGWLPHHAKAIAAVQDRLWDLLPMMREYVYHPGFKGSFSLKTVLPSLVPEMAYEGMEVAKGSMAGVVYDRLISGTLSPNEYARQRKALLEYCRQDTMGMVKIIESLGGLVPEGLLTKSRVGVAPSAPPARS